ncbi:uncharacterized protein LOC141648830 [Silene latifolia]|uniref:uncharacterized protein LOC141648830 n=1 Tax=Silene latifolia TaxID=37657 RepID=UPI003D7843B1
MELGNEKKDGNFRWTDNDVTVLCEVCINYIHKNGRGQAFRWHEIHKEVQEKTGRKYQFKSMKNKFDSMRTDWYLWKFLKNGETGLGLDPASGRISASDEWWKNKIAAKPDAKKFKNKPLNPTFEDLYFQIFESKRATEEGVVAPSMDPSSVNVVNVEGDLEGDLNEGNDEDDTYYEYSQHSSVLGNLESQEQSFYSNFLKEVSSDTQAPTSNQGLDNNLDTHGLNNFDTQVPHMVHTQNTSATQANTGEKRSTSCGSKLPQSSIRKTIKPTQMKRRRRQSAGSAMLSGQIGDMVNTCTRALEKFWNRCQSSYY